MLKKRFCWVLCGLFLALAACGDKAEPAAQLIQSVKIIALEKKICGSGESEPREYCYDLKITTQQLGSAPLNNFIYQLLTHDKKPLAGDLETALIRYIETRLAELKKSQAKENEFHDVTEDKELTLAGMNGDYLNFIYVVTAYDGGAHENWDIQNIVLDAKNLEPVPLNAILRGPPAAEELFQLQHAALVSALLAKDNIDATRAQIEATLKEWKLSLSSNWRFGRNGLIFTYSPYEIGPFYWGDTEIAIPAGELKNIVKPEVLQSLKTWKDAAPEQK